MISSISLKNFKTFDDEAFKIAPLTLVMGLNGMGKSSILQSLLLLKQNYENENLDKESKFMRLEGDYVSLEDSQSLCYQWAEDRTVKIGLTINNNINQIWQMDAETDDLIDLPTVVSDDNYDIRSIFADGFAFIGADRLMPDKYYPSISSKTYKSTLGIKGELTPAYLHKALNSNEDIAIEGMKSTKAIDNQLVNNVNAWMSEIMNIDMTATTEQPDPQNIKLKYTIDNSSIAESFSPLQVGFGLTYTLPVITELLIAKKNDLVLIENPEAHLHPSAQVKLGEMIGRCVANGVQVIVETHSDHIINGVRLARKNRILSLDSDVNLIFVERKNLNGVTISTHNDVYITDDGKFSEPLPDCFNTWTDTLVKLI